MNTRIIEDKDAINLIIAEYNNVRLGIQKAKNHLHLMLGLSLTIGGITFSFLTDGLNKEVDPNNLKFLQIGFFASTAIQWLIALNYQGHFRDLFNHSLYVKKLAKQLRKGVKNKTLKKSFLMWEEYSLKENNSKRNKVIVALTWGVPLMIPALLGYLSMVIGDRITPKSIWTTDIFFSYYLDWTLAGLLVIATIFNAYDALTKWK